MSAPSTLQRLRQVHAAVAPLVLLPLLATAVTGSGIGCCGTGLDWTGSRPTC